MKIKKLPIRMCIGCRENKPKRELIRIVKTQAGDIVLDNTGRLAGRGAYICPNTDCLSKCIKSHMLEKAFSAPVGPEIYARLAGELKKLE